MARKRRKSKIDLPVLKRIAVRDYQLYPGIDDESGFEHELINGVSVIVGINGIGKTTLLHLIFRLITGPFDPSKLDPSKPVSGNHDLVRLQKYRYFSDRVEDDAVDAWAEIDLQFGDRLLTVRRRMSDLQLLALEEGDEEYVELTEETYQDVCCELSGTETPYDFHFIIRNLVFFLEERAPLIWSDEGQFEMLRILFFKSIASQEVANLSDSARQIDSQFRNRLYHVNSERKKFEKLLRETENQDQTTQDLASLEAQVTGDEQYTTSLTEQLETLSGEIDKLEAEVYKLQIDIEEKRQSIRHAEMSFFSQLFPTTEDTTKLIFNSLLTGDNCLVCGSDGVDAATRIRAALKKNHCPVCDSTPEQQENSNIKPLAGGSLKKISKQYDRLKERLVQRQRTLEERRADYRKSAQDLRDRSRELFTNRRQIERLRDRIPADQDELLERESKLSRDEKELNRLKNRRTKALESLRSKILAQQSQIDRVADSIVAKFGHYAKSFLAEDCHLEYGLVDQPIGQSGAHVSLPSFSVFLSSGAHEGETEREDSDQVSESQKEFIDLAFRMALMESATEDGLGRMLVVETPEASLDSIFIEQAGDLLRKFARTPKGGAGNVVLASCNLNGAEMIQNLLDTARRGRNAPRKRSVEAINRRIIDLIDIAAPSAAYKKFSEEYDLLRESIYG